MKKIFCFVAFFLTVVFCASAQKELGEYIEIDGVPSFVIHYDEDGIHGVAMSIFAFGEKGSKNIDKYIKKGIMTDAQGKIFKDNPIGEINSLGMGGKTDKKMLADLIEYLSNDGKKNQERIEAFCVEKGVSLQEKFPMQYWAKCLGEGWFIPGDQELTYFANTYYGGLGRSNSLGSKFLSHAKELCNNELVQEVLTFVVVNGLYSSSCSDATCGFKALRWQFVPLTGKNYMDIFDCFRGKTPMVCAAHKF